MMSSKSDPLCFGIVAFFIGLGLIYGAVQKYRLILRIKNTPTSKARSAALGLSEFSGKAVCLDTIESPISKAKCTYWRVCAEYYRQAGKHSSWVMIYNKESHSKFYLQDDSGRVLVDPENAEVDIPFDLSSTGHINTGGVIGLFTNTVLSPKALAYAQSDQEIMRYSRNNIKITEYFIAENDPLYVLGGVFENPEPATSAVKIQHARIRNPGTKTIDSAFERSGADWADFSTSSTQFLPVFSLLLPCHFVVLKKCAQQPDRLLPRTFIALLVAGQNQSRLSAKIGWTRD